MLLFSLLTIEVHMNIIFDIRSIHLDCSCQTTYVECFLWSLNHKECLSGSLLTEVTHHFHCDTVNANLVEPFQGDLEKRI